MESKNERAVGRMVEKGATWPVGLIPRTAEEWRQCAKDWANSTSRGAINRTLRTLKVSAATYAGLSPDARAELVIDLQNALLGEQRLAERKESHDYMLAGMLLMRALIQIGEQEVRTRAGIKELVPFVDPGILGLNPDGLKMYCIGVRQTLDAAGAEDARDAVIEELQDEAAKFRKERDDLAEELKHLKKLAQNVIDVSWYHEPSNHNRRWLGSETEALSKAIQPKEKTDG